jgi:hypothetical protein
LHCNPVAVYGIPSLLWMFWVLYSWMNVFRNEMRKEQPCLQHIRKLGWINLYASSVLRAKIEHTSCCLVSSDLRGECSVTCLLSAPLMHGWHSPLSLSAVMKPGAVEWLWILCNILDWVSCLQIPKIYSAYIVPKEHEQLTF